MRAVRWHARGDVRVEEVPPPAPPGPGELQLRVRWCGICGTDLEEWLSGPVFIPASVPHPLTGARAPATRTLATTQAPLPATRKSEAPAKASRKAAGPADDDDLKDIEAILRKRGI